MPPLELLKPFLHLGALPVAHFQVNVGIHNPVSPGFKCHQSWSISRCNVPQVRCGMKRRNSSVATSLCKKNDECWKHPMHLRPPRAPKITLMICERPMASNWLPASESGNQETYVLSQAHWIKTFRSLVSSFSMLPCRSSHCVCDLSVLNVQNGYKMILKWQLSHQNSCPAELWSGWATPDLVETIANGADPSACKVPCATTGRKVLIEES